MSAMWLFDSAATSRYGQDWKVKGCESQNTFLCVCVCLCPTLWERWKVDPTYLEFFSREKQLVWTWWGLVYLLKYWNLHMRQGLRGVGRCGVPQKDTCEGSLWGGNWPDWQVTLSQLGSWTQPKKNVSITQDNAFVCFVYFLNFSSFLLFTKQSNSILVLFMNSVVMEIAQWSEKT